MKISNWREHDEVGRLFARAVFGTSKAKYVVGNSATLLYPAAGGSDDYASSIGVPLSYTIEVTKASYGFVLPSSQIKNIGDEVFSGCRAAALYVADKEWNDI